MISVGEDDLICDLAETYRIYDMRSLPAGRAAVLSCGLSEDSRIKRRLRGERVEQNTLLAAMIYDRLNWLCWSKTKNASRGVNRPPSLAAKLLNPPKENDLVSFSDADGFEKRRREIMNS